MIAALLLLADATPTLAVPPAVFADATISGAAPTLSWPRGTRLSVGEADGEIVARFDRPLPPRAIEGFRVAAGDALEDLRWNDDSLVLRAAPGWDMRWRRSPDTLTVEFAPPPVVVTASPEDPGALEADVALVEAEAAAGYPGRARRRAAALAATRREDRRLARLASDTALADGDLFHAADGYRALAADDPVARRALATAPGTVAASIVARDGGDLSQVEAGARADVAIDARWSVGAGLRHVATRIADTDDAGSTVVDASVGIALEGAARLQVLLSSAIDSDVTGGGARLTAGSAEAQLRAIVVFHMPDFSTGVQALRGGHLSRAGAGGTYRLSPDWVVQADTGWNRYGLDGANDAADTIVLAGGVDYLLRRGSPSVGIGYRVEAEYVRRLARDALGVALIPLATRENHTVQGVVSGSMGAVQLTGQAGYTVDRFGGDGPTAGIGVNAPIGDGWRIDGGGGVTSVSRPGFSGTQVYGRAQVTRGLGRGR
ncbi:hypothetical protein ASG29_15290 [Sphingomonas sp. Leaf412]|uniref:hypothetical protein n=1 Tax=Sphingomonas sp. Leaf412 TaxID=1736370 RepID=UPI0006F9AB99|nr:hypothetical protein [Sphingomonas sp. Leaf412]KQT31322.1 hypothetical protein ASG29_15290 [Sphingomonas sp. Leaf412]